MTTQTYLVVSDDSRGSKHILFAGPFPTDTHYPLPEEWVDRCKTLARTHWPDPWDFCYSWKSVQFREGATLPEPALDRILRPVDLLTKKIPFFLSKVLTSPRECVSI